MADKPGVIRKTSFGDFAVWNGKDYAYENSLADAKDTAKAIFGGDITLKIMPALKGQAKGGIVSRRGGGKIMQGYKAGGKV